MQTSGYADADRIRTKNNKSPPHHMVGGHNDLDLLILNVDVINMSNAHPSLFRSCLYKQTAIYYFIEASWILTSSPDLDPGVHRCRMEENPPRYPHTKYE